MKIKITAEISIGGTVSSHTEIAEWDTPMERLPTISSVFGDTINAVPVGRQSAFLASLVENASLRREPGVPASRTDLAEAIGRFADAAVDVGNLWEEYFGRSTKG